MSATAEWTEGRITEPEGRPTEITQSEQQRENIETK